MIPKQIINKMVGIPPWVLGLAGFGAAYLLFRKRDAGGSLGKDIGEGAGKLAGSIVTGALDMVGGIFTGTTEVLTGGVIPVTSHNSCCDSIDKYNAAANWSEKMTASFSVSLNCPASDYLKWAANGARPGYCGATAKPATKTAPGGGLIIYDSPLGGPSFEDLSRPDQYYINYVPDVIPQPDAGKLLTPVAGLRG